MHFRSTVRTVNFPFDVVTSQIEGVAEEFPHAVAHRAGGRARQVVVDLEQVRLDVGVRRVEHQVRVRPTRHLGHVLVAVDDLRYEHYLVLQQLNDVLVLALLGELTAHRPHLPGHAFGAEGPSRPSLLEELEAYGTFGRRRRAIGSPEQFRELRYLDVDVAAELLRLAAHVGEVDEVAVDVQVADGAYRVALLVVVGELAAGAVEEDRVEYAGDYLVHLAALHRHLEGDGARVHGAASRSAPRGHYVTARHGASHRVTARHSQRTDCPIYKVSDGSSPTLKRKMTVFSRVRRRVGGCVFTCVCATIRRLEFIVPKY